jgi:N-acetylglucosaminyl-diphospho-decaprenol L-rhamnosyltransferase
MDLSLVLVNYRHRVALAACLDSLPAACAGLQYEVIVVDNASGDGLIEDYARNRPTIRTIANTTNEGFARGVNRGLAIAQGRCVGLLNPDTIAYPDAFTRMVRFLDAHPEVGLVGPKVTDPDGGIQYSCRRYPTHWAGLFNRYSLLTKMFPRNRWSRSYLMLDFDHASTLDVDWITGACILARRDAVEAVGPLDPEFFLFNEDIDWSKRMHQAGYRVVYLPEAHVMHVIGASKGPLPLWLIWRRHMGMMHYYHKHHPGPWYWTLLTDAGILLRCAHQFVINPLRALTKGRPIK